MSSVDVVVPCYNYGRYLEYCVGTVLSQRDVDVRVLIIDDLSRDDTPVIGARLAARDPRVTFRRHEQNQGLIGTANEGIMAWATARYTLLLSADDALTPGALARAARVLDAHPEAGMVYGMAQIVTEDCPRGDIDAAPDFDYQILSGISYLRHSCESGNEVPSPTAVVRTELQHRIGGYHPALPHTSDMEMWMRIATQSSIAVVNAVQGYYRWHGSNMTSRYISGPLSDRQTRISACNEVYKAWGAETPELGIRIEAMRRRYAAEACWLAGVAMERGDEEGVRACLAFATKHDPALWRSPSWWRFLAKRRVGPDLWRKLRTALRGAPDAAPSAETSDALEIGRCVGWWPEVSMEATPGRISAMDAAGAPVRRGAIA